MLTNSAVYDGNIGFVEMVEFYRKASPKQIKLMGVYIESGDWNKFKVLIERVLGVTLR